MSFWALTLDVEVLRVALAVSLGVGGDAREEPGVVPADLLQDERVIPDKDPGRDVLLHEFALETQRMERGEQ